MLWTATPRTIEWFGYAPFFSTKELFIWWKNYLLHFGIKSPAWESKSFFKTWTRNFLGFQPTRNIEANIAWIHVFSIGSRSVQQNTKNLESAWKFGFFCFDTWSIQRMRVNRAKRAMKQSCYIRSWKYLGGLIAVPIAVLEVWRKR